MSLLKTVLIHTSVLKKMKISAKKDFEIQVFFTKVACNDISQRVFVFFMDIKFKGSNSIRHRQRSISLALARRRQQANSECNKLADERLSVSGAGDRYMLQNLLTKKCYKAVSSKLNLSFQLPFSKNKGTGIENLFFVHAKS